MARFALLALLVPTLCAVAAPIKRAAVEFGLQSYDQFQISSGVAGNAEAEAAAVFITPFGSTDLSTVDATSLANLGTMREAAESAETDLFDPAIAAASGATAAALQVGKIKNKVLKLTGEVQQIKIKIAIAQAKGTDTSDLETSLTAETTKLNNNIATDKASAGQTSQAVTEGATPAAVDAASTAAVATTKAAKTKAAKTKAATTKAAKTAKAAETTAAAAAAAAATPVQAASAATFTGFALKDYADFQISSDPAGNAQAEAAAVFIAPFPEDLSTVDATSLANLGTMREAAESAETDLFDPAIAAASGAAAAALQVGKIKNKVLKLTGEVQQLKIKIAIAQATGADTSALETSLTAEQTKLTNNIATDVKSKGDASQSVA